MPVTCIVVGCGSRGDKDRVKFYYIPAVLNHRFLPEKNELSRRRRTLWLNAIKREDLTDTKVKYQRVCSKHFITGKPAALDDANYPDWVPSQNMGHKSQSVNKHSSDVERKHRVDKRRKRQVEQAEVDRNTSIEYESIENNEEQATGLATQTNLTMQDLDTLSDQVKFAATKIATLKAKVENSPFGLRDEQSNADKWKYYTGFTYDTVNLVLFPLVEAYIPSTSTTVPSPFNQ